LPAHCDECGKPYPWTESRLAAAKELIELTEADPGEQETLKESLPALTGDTPQAQVAATRMRKFLLGSADASQGGRHVGGFGIPLISGTRPD
jgi:hypothetical protein